MFSEWDFGPRRGISEPENVEERGWSPAEVGLGWNQIILMVAEFSPLRKPGNNPFIGIMKDYLLFILILKDNQCRVFHGQWPWYIYYGNEMQAFTELSWQIQKKMTFSPQPCWCLIECKDIVFSFHSLVRNVAVEKPSLQMSRFWGNAKSK